MPSDNPPTRTPPLPFVQLMALKRLGGNNSTTQSGSVEEAEKEEHFQSIAPPYAPGIANAAFGGHVFAQAAYAASQTVKKGFVIHNISGFFLRLGQLDVPFIYSVRHVRDGGNFCLRAVEARQKGRVCFSCLCSFKRPETQQANSSHQPPFSDLRRRYGSLIRGKRPEDHPLAPGIDAPWHIQAVEAGKHHERDFPGVEVRKVDMEQYNQTDEVKKNPHEYRQLQFYRFRGSPDIHEYEHEGGNGAGELQQSKGRDGEYDNLFACAHLYASDKNSLFIIPRALGHPDDWTMLTSLSLTVIFHQHGDKLRMIDWDSGERKWFLEEFWTSRSGENRALHETRLWTADGILLATAVQDSLVRLKGSGGFPKL
ncbi:hypothetical protein VTN77DRAFT_9493 [Rasamsonia byssochlamydoides]|uniref:uncharacterized protein n=1 Tax=Rasamsonia byssochlamydoides TaxID=89139 RepID=UPI003742972A